MASDLPALLRSLDRVDPMASRGRIEASVGLSLRATLPGATIGAAARIHRRNGETLDAEVVGFDAEDTLLMPLGDPRGLAPGDPIELLDRGLFVTASSALLGRVLDGLGRPIDDGPQIEGERMPLLRGAPPPLSRPPITEPLTLGIRAIDACATVGRGQRLGLFAGPGVGKSTLLAQIANGAAADVVVVALVGERSREVGEFLKDALGDEGLRRSVVVCATSDAPALLRMRSAHTATAIAEFFRDRGRSVLLVLDSLTRFARAAREVALSTGEPPARRGYPPSVFAHLPALLERAGTARHGSITAFYTVLVEGGDLEEPITDEVRGILDGHIVLDRRLAERGRFPAIDVPTSLSRCMQKVTSEEHRADAARLRRALALYEEKRDLVELGAYTRGSDPHLDAVLDRLDDLEAFLRQRPEEHHPFPDTLHALRRLA